jgi:hypothetical protein
MIGNGTKGGDVLVWQRFLLVEGFALPHGADGQFGAETVTATKSFQTRHGLAETGALDDPTLAAARREGFLPADDGAAPVPTAAGILKPDWPPPPSLRSPTVQSQQLALGPLEYVGRPGTDEITITNDFEKKNIIVVTIPQLQAVMGASKNFTIRWHRGAEAQLLALWSAWEHSGLLSRVLQWGGSYEPRFVRPQAGQPVPPPEHRSLSNHAFGAAFDINVEWNPLGEVPALVGKRGSVRELVIAANRLGFFWGGHYAGRKDGMHFEVAKLMTSGELAVASQGLV